MGTSPTSASVNAKERKNALRRPVHAPILRSTHFPWMVIHAGQPGIGPMKVVGTSSRLFLVPDTFIGKFEHFAKVQL